MQQFEAVAKKWGNSIGITIPNEVVKQEHLKPQKKVTILVVGEHDKKPKTVYGSLHLKKKTQQVMDEWRK